MYRFTRIPAPGWDFYQALPALGAEHHVRFPQAGITPANRYQLLMFVDQPTDVRIDSQGFAQTMQPGQTSMDVVLAGFDEGALWVETPAAEGARRMCLSPAGPQRRWIRTVHDLPDGGLIPVPAGGLGILLRGEARLASTLEVMVPGQHVAIESAVVVEPGGRLLVATLSQ